MKEPLCEPAAASSRWLLGCSWNVLWHWQSGTGGTRQEWMPDAKCDAAQCSCSRDSSSTLWCRVRGAEGSPEVLQVTKQQNKPEQRVQTLCLEAEMPFSCPAGSLISCSSKSWMWAEWPQTHVPAHHVRQSSSINGTNSCHRHRLYSRVTRLSYCNGYKKRSQKENTKHNRKGKQVTSGAGWCKKFLNRFDIRSDIRPD